MKTLKPILDRYIIVWRWCEKVLDVHTEKDRSLVWNSCCRKLLEPYFLIFVRTYVWIFTRKYISLKAVGISRIVSETSDFFKMSSSSGLFEVYEKDYCNAATSLADALSRLNGIPIGEYSLWTWRKKALNDGIREGCWWMKRFLVSLFGLKKYDIRGILRSEGWIADAVMIITMMLLLLSDDLIIIFHIVNSMDRKICGQWY